jgi:uncharacterized protein (DUF3084 family)
MPGRREVGFEVERFEWTEADRLEVMGRWYGLKGRRFVRPVLSVQVGEDRRRLVALLDHKPWPAVEDTPWVAAFPWSGERTGVGAAELEVGRNLVIDLPPPRLPRRRRAEEPPPAEERQERITWAREDPPPVPSVASDPVPLDKPSPPVAGPAEPPPEEAVDELEAELWRVRAALASAREDAEEAQAEAARRVAQERVERQRLAEAAEAAEARLRRDLDEQEQARSELAAAREQLEHDLHAARSEIDQLRGEFAEAAEETEGALGRAREEATGLSEQLAAAQRELGEARESHAREAQRLKEEVGVWQARFAEEHDKHKRLKAEQASTLERLAAARAEGERSGVPTREEIREMREKLIAERDDANRERNEMIENWNALIAQRDEAIGARDEALSARDSAVGERDSAVGERDAAVSERDAAVSERDRVTGERDRAVSERDAVMSERDSAISDRHGQDGERDRVMAERDAAATERARLATELDELKRRNTVLQKQLAAATENGGDSAPTVVSGRLSPLGSTLPDVEPTDRGATRTARSQPAVPPPQTPAAVSGPPTQPSAGDDEPRTAKLTRAVTETAERAVGQLTRLTGRRSAAEATTDGNDTATTSDTFEAPVRTRARSARRTPDYDAGARPARRSRDAERSAVGVWAIRAVALVLLAILLIALAIIVSSIA